MAKRHNPPQKRSKKRGGKFIPALCNVLGTLFLLLVIVLLLPLGLPKLMGYQVFNVVSGSMEPTIPVGSMILVKPMEGSEIEEKDIILFHTSEETVVTHRVMENHVVEGEFITKGTAKSEYKDFQWGSNNGEPVQRDILRLAYNVDFGSGKIQVSTNDTLVVQTRESNKRVFFSPKYVKQ